jgi:hypothetical protein
LRAKFIIGLQDTEGSWDGSILGDTVESNVRFHDGVFGVGIVTANLQLNSVIFVERNDGFVSKNDLGASGVGPSHVTIQKGCQKGIEQHAPDHLAING